MQTVTTKYRREATAEQKAKTAARRERFREFARQIAAMQPEERAALAAKCPVCTIEGKALSVRNQCMVAMQRPSATIVGGFRQWFGRRSMRSQGRIGIVDSLPEHAQG